MRRPGRSQRSSSSQKVCTGALLCWIMFGLCLFQSREIVITTHTKTFYTTDSKFVVTVWGRPHIGVMVRCPQASGHVVYNCRQLHSIQFNFIYIALLTDIVTNQLCRKHKASIHTFYLQVTSCIVYMY